MEDPSSGEWKIPAPVNGWGRDPAKSDTSNSASIERIKRIRNVCCHPTNGQMSDEKFKEYWKDLEQSVRNLELNFPGEYNPTYSSALALIKTGHLDCNTQELSKNEEKHDEDNEIKCTERQGDAREMCEADIHRCFSESGTFPGLITCTKWNARSPKKKASKFIRDPHIVIIIHGVTNPCFTHEECIKSVQAYQDFHMDTKGWDNIGYNFLIGEDGNAYEGRGPDSIGAHTLGYNAFSIGICFIGNYNLRLPNPKALDTSKRLIKWLVESGKIPENYTLKGHRDLRPTESPGQLLYQEIQNWPHYRQTAQYQK
ncbi:peptidoglycan recognition protein-like [Ostrea edulis]|uniref:peptidoglycan recognition protein-like n=1 Tax=Ostrea edulis TaxID=37623 RepID=UPI0024AF971A|nr:peptidoglycan recognition protein-like [Ostrea edulis]